MLWCRRESKFTWFLRLKLVSESDSCSRRNCLALPRQSETEENAKVGTSSLLVETFSCSEDNPPTPTSWDRSGILNCPEAYSSQTDGELLKPAGWKCWGLCAGEEACYQRPAGMALQLCKFKRWLRCGVLCMVWENIAWNSNNLYLGQQVFLR